MATKEKAQKVPVPTERQRAVLDACKGGRSVKIVDANGKKRIEVVSPAGKPIAGDAKPKLDRAAVEGCVKQGWLNVSGASGTPGGSETLYKITDDGLAAKKRKAAKAAK